MRVLIVRGFPDQLNIDSYNVQEIGLAAALRRQGVETDIVFYGGKNTKEQTLADGTTIYWLQGWNIVKNGVMPALKALAAGYDVLQVNEYDQLQSWLIYTFWNKPCVIYHGLYASLWTRGYNKKCAVFDHLFLPFSGRAKRRVPCLTKSPLSAQTLRDKGFQLADSVGVGLNPAPFLPTREEITNARTQHATHDRIELAYIGKLEPRRSSDLLVNLLGRLAADEDVKDRIHCTIIGTGEDSYVQQLMPEIERLSATGILEYRRKATQQELAHLYPQMDILLFPSRFEIFGMVLLEAMYHGCVCASSYNGGSATLIDDGIDGRIVQQFDEDAWLSAIKRLILQDAERSAMSLQAMNKIHEHFLWDALAASFIKTYQQAIENYRT